MVHISEAAGHKIKEMMAQEEHSDALYLRLQVKPGGCTGFTYGMGFDKEKHEDDRLFEEKGISVLVDKESIPLINGLEIDYKESMMGGGFTLNNPNAIATCGCGTSFRTATKAGNPEKC